MAGIATVQIVGNLGRDPETGITPNGKTNLKFSIAVSRKTRDGEATAWYAVTCWGQLAETMTDLAQRGAIAKGTKVFVSGRLEPREYTDKTGAVKTSLDISANEVHLVGSRAEGGSQPAQGTDIDEIGF